MMVLNFSHPLTGQQLRDIEAATSRCVDEVRDVPAQFNEQYLFPDQAIALADACDLTPADWQTEPMLIVPPAFNFIAVTLLAELHGRMGYFPPVVRLRRRQGDGPPSYEVAEVINLQSVRDVARGKRRRKTSLADAIADADIVRLLPD